MTKEAMKFLAIAITMLAVMPSAIGEGWVVSHAIDGIYLSPFF